jgi:hypothetical protein
MILCHSFEAANKQVSTHDSVFLMLHDSTVAVDISYLHLLVQRCDRLDQLPLTMFSESLTDGKLRKLGDPSCQPLSRARDQSDTLLVKRCTITLICAHAPFWISISRICQCFWPACSTSDGVSAASEPVRSSSACRRSKCQHSRHSAIYNTIQASDSSSEVHMMLIEC